MSSILKQKHPYHLVDPSPWPLVLSISCLVTAFGAATFMHSFHNGDKILLLGLTAVICGMAIWWRDVIREATFNGNHTKTVQHGLRSGMILFIVSEVMFFFAFFWAFFHSSLSPAVEIGSIWPPKSIDPFNPWGVPLLNTFILLLSGSTITWAHHEIIAGNKENAKYGMFFTLFLAVTFTALQAYEYIEAPFSISDGVYGSTFFMATGFHGYFNMIAPTNLILAFASLSCLSPDVKDNSLRIEYKGKSYHLNNSFLQWLAGFTDAEGNFNISFRNFNGVRYNSVILTFQIGLHINDLDTLKYIQRKLNCGHISVSGMKCNFFVNDRDSLIYVILPIFSYVTLQSTKYFQFLIFKKCVTMIADKAHLTEQGKLIMIKYHAEMKECNSQKDFPSRGQRILNDYWLGGFTDGDGCFSANGHIPKLKFENHIKELDLLRDINAYLGKNVGNLTIVKPNKNRPNANPMVILEFNQVTFLKNNIAALLAKPNVLLSNKFKDFTYWALLVNIYYFGYHTLPEGLSLAKRTKLRMNKRSALQELDDDFDYETYKLFNTPSPYVEKDGSRYIRNSENDKLVRVAP